MGRSCINLVGNTTQGQNLGAGKEVYAGKSFGNTLKFKSFDVAGTTMKITCDSDTIYFSAGTGGGSFTTDCLITTYPSNNIGMGSSVLTNISSSDFNIAIGNNAIDALTGGSCNIAVGVNAMQNVTGGSTNIAMGIGAMYNAGINGSSVNGSNLAIGYHSMYNADTHSSVAIGESTMSNAGGYQNIAIGRNLLVNVIGHDNIAMGFQAMRVGVNGNFNIALGLNSLCAVEDDCNIGIGTYSLCALSGGTGNVGLGVDSLANSENGCYNVAVGYLALHDNINGCRNVALGNNAGRDETGSNTLHIANTNTCSLIYGEFDNKLVCVDEKLITCKFQMISGATDGYVLTSDASGNASWEAGGGGLSASNNGLCDNGTTVSLGGDLTGTTTIYGGGAYDYGMIFDNMNNFCVDAAAGLVHLIGCNGSEIKIGQGIQLCSGSATSICMFDLPAKSSETNVLYIDSVGKISSGATGGGGTPARGSNTQVQYNSSGSFAGSANFTFDGTNVDVSGSVCAADFELTSDERCKTSICEYIPTLADVQYRQFELCNCLGQTRFGVIAQELQEIYPEVVRTNEEGYLSVSYIDLLVREVAYLKNKVQELEKKIG